MSTRDKPQQSSISKDEGYIPISLYIHIPWCIQKCPYCDFNSHKLNERDSSSGDAEKNYIHRLIEDFKENFTKDRPIHSIFFGGGTPSLFQPDSYELLLAEIDKFTSPPKPIEITLEANPGTADESRFKGYRAIGINRLSIGVQSFHSEKLSRLGRIHDASQAKKAFYMAQEAGFENINLDLMYGLPNQTVKEALDDLQTAIALRPQHISWYQLTLEPNTVFYKRPPLLPDEETLWQIETEGKQLLRQYYQQYEISAYSQPGYRCYHNLNYWLFGDYLGIGAGAHSKLTSKRYLNHTDERFTLLRSQKKRQPQDYLDRQKNPLAKQWEISEQEIIFEFMLNALRLVDMPISWTLFKERTGLSPQSENLQQTLKKAQSMGLLAYDDEGFQVTPLGHQYLNNLQQMFLPS